MFANRKWKSDSVEARANPEHVKVKCFFNVPKILGRCWVPFSAETQKLKNLYYIKRQKLRNFTRPTF